MRRHKYLPSIGQTLKPDEMAASCFVSGLTFTPRWNQQSEPIVIFRAVHFIPSFQLDKWFNSCSLFVS
ncbi:hypothetical protein DAI22_03g024000 [Oryza sativa Japonica Group]|nr:hypothetical protein DAI22_03g024000 [Oryza sativa Japonica Group]